MYREALNQFAYVAGDGHLNIASQHAALISYIGVTEDSCWGSGIIIFAPLHDLFSNQSPTTNDNTKRCKYSVTATPGDDI
jgi:hypothetical protein